MASRTSRVLALTAVTVVAGVTGLGPSSARADRPTVRGFVGGAADRARRALSFGPIVGAGLGYAWRPGTVEVPITFGVGAVLFAIPVAPGPAAIEAMIVDRTKARLADRVKARVATGQPLPDADELVRMEAEVLAEVKDEILGQRAYVGRTLERPRLAVAVEGAYLPRADAWQLRATVGVGIKKATLGPSITGTFGGDRGLYLGGELAVHLTPWPRPRSHVIDVFLRVDLGVTDATADAHQVGLGARLLLDLL